MNDNRVTLGLNYERAVDSPERRQARQIFIQLAQDLANGSVHTPEIDYYLGAVYNHLEDFPKGQDYFQRSALSEPINYDAYIEQGNKALLLASTSKLTGPDLNNLYESAKAMFRTALTARDDSSEALTGLAVVALFQNDANEALKWSNAAVAANPNYAAAWVSQANANRKAAAVSRKNADVARGSAKDTTLVAGDRLDFETKARDAEAAATKFETQERASLTQASKLDPQISGLEINDVKVVWRYYSVGGRRPLIPAPRERERIPSRRFQHDVRQNHHWWFVFTTSTLCACSTRTP
jgi:tetratricopeptide (TPR) repeat protein